MHTHYIEHGELGSWTASAKGQHRKVQQTTLQNCLTQCIGTSCSCSVEPILASCLLLSAAGTYSALSCLCCCMIATPLDPKLGPQRAETLCLCLMQADIFSPCLPAMMGHLVMYGQHDAAHRLAELGQSIFTATGKQCPWEGTISRHMAAVKALTEVQCFAPALLLFCTTQLRCVLLAYQFMCNCERLRSPQLCKHHIDLLLAMAGVGQRYMSVFKCHRRHFAPTRMFVKQKPYSALNVSTIFLCHYVKEHAMAAQEQQCSAPVLCHAAGGSWCRQECSRG